MSSTRRQYYVVAAESNIGRYAIPYMLFRLREANRTTGTPDLGYHAVGERDPYGSTIELMLLWGSEDAQRLMAAYQTMTAIPVTYEVPDA